jgi:hypothetical protein
VDTKAKRDKTNKKQKRPFKQKANHSKETKPLKKFNTLKVAILNPLATNQTPVASAKHQTHRLHNKT